MENERETRPLVIIGGGAAGFFAAAQIREKSPELPILILEKSAKTLHKVLISGGGRCNVTHACFDPRELTGFYPRGERELIGPFHKFQPGDTIEWFENKGIALKTEEDGRMFPATDSSETIADCLRKTALSGKTELRTKSGVSSLYRKGNIWKISLREGEVIHARTVLIATGSNHAVWKMLSGLGLKTVAPVPSLFTFNTKDLRLKGMAGVSLPNVRLRVPEADLETEGPFLVTHWGMSGPAILKLSAWGARRLHELNYRFNLHADFLPETNSEDLEKYFAEQRKNNGKRKVKNSPVGKIPKRFWQNLCEVAGAKRTWAELRRSEEEALLNGLKDAVFPVRGKSTFKDEFVTAGGVRTDEVNFRTMEAKHFPGLFLSGEVLDIDAVTGGFNFQAAWTTATLAAEGILRTLEK